MSAVRVHRTTWLADGVVQVELRDTGGAELATWEPGAHLGLHLPNGLIRQYSLCGDPADRHTWTVAVLREPASRGGSSWVHERLTAGSIVDVDPPRNNFALTEAEGYLLIAGGIGITPLLAMARSIEAEGKSWRMVYCGRSRRSMAFLSELDSLAGDRLTTHADDEQGGPPDVLALLAGLSSGTAVYCCGPEPLIAAVEAAAPNRAQVHVERFRPVAATAPSSADSAFDVVCAGSGTRVRVEPDLSVLDALTLAGMDVPFSCGEGVCGSCETKVLDGEPDHRDFVLTDAEKQANASMMLCVSRCRSAELVLDLG